MNLASVASRLAGYGTEIQTRIREASSLEQLGQIAQEFEVSHYVDIDINAPTVLFLSYTLIHPP